MRAFTSIFIVLINMFWLSSGDAQSNYFKNRQLISLANDVQIEKIGSHLWRHVTWDRDGNRLIYPTNGLIITDKKNAIVVDTGWNPAQTQHILSFIEHTLHKKVILSIVTHWHADRMGGIEVLKQRHIRTLSSVLTAQLAHVHLKPIPDEQFQNKTVIKLGGEKIIVDYPGAGHTEDNIVVWMPAARLLFGGCLIKSKKANNLGYIDEANLSAWSKTIAYLQSEYPDVQIVIPGHGQYGNAALLTHTLGLLNRN